MIVLLICAGFALYNKLDKNSTNEVGKEQINNTNQQLTITPGAKSMRIASTPISSDKKVIDTTINELKQKAPTQQTDSAIITKLAPDNSEKTHIGIVITEKRYFYSEPKPEKRRKGFLVKGQHITYTITEGDFIYATYITENGTTTGWLFKSDIQ